VRASCGKPEEQSLTLSSSLVLSPITSYADQIFSIHRSKSSDGFSLDIPLIMLVASILKYARCSPGGRRMSILTEAYRIFYWFGAYYSSSLLLQACLMIVMQLMLLKVALDNRPPIGAKYGLEHAPFSQYAAPRTLQSLLSGQRPYDFWQWTNARPLVEPLSYLVASVGTDEHGPATTNSSPT
jgi:hypothetical protein